MEALYLLLSPVFTCHCPIQDYLLLDVRVIYMLFADASSSFSLDYASHQGRREAINIEGGGRFVVMF